MRRKARIRKEQDRKPRRARRSAPLKSRPDHRPLAGSGADASALLSRPSPAPARRRPEKTELRTAPKKPASTKGPEGPAAPVTVDPLVAPPVAESKPKAATEDTPAITVAVAEPLLTPPAPEPVTLDLIIPPPPADLATKAAAAVSKAGKQMGSEAKKTKELPSAETATGAARANVEEPAQETAARAQGALTAALREKPKPSPEIEALCADIQQRIKERRPVDEEEMRKTDPAKEAGKVGDQVGSSIDEKSEATKGEYDQVNETPTGEPGQTAAPIPAVPQPQKGKVSAEAAVPDPTPPEDLSLDADLEASQQEVADAGMETEAAKLVDSGPIADAREGVDGLAETAAVDPAKVAAEQATAIADSKTAMRELEAAALEALSTSRATTVGGSSNQQRAMVGSEEQQRTAAADRAEKLFTDAQDKVNKLLEPLSKKAMERWEAGKAKIVTDFDTALDKAKAMVDERHEGVGGFFVSIVDGWAGLPREITLIYDIAERKFGDEICKLIREISTFVNGVILACEAIIEQADKDIAAVFDQLPESLRGWAEEQKKGFETRLEGLNETVKTAQTDFNKQLTEAADGAVEEARKRIAELRQAAKGWLQKIADALNEFLKDPALFIINGLLKLVGIAPASFWALMAKIAKAKQDMADDPMGFANNLMDAIGQGFDRFFENFGDHLLTGFVNWLMSAMGTVGVQLPPDTSVGSIITFFLQVMGLTWERVSKVLAKHVGEENVELLEKAYDLLQLLMKEGPRGIFEMLKEQLNPQEMLNTVIEAAVAFMVEAIVKAATVRIIGLFNPVGAIFQAIEAIYRVISWVMENAARIFTLIETVVNGIADIIAGNISGMAKRVEGALVMLLVPVIDFVAGFLGLGDLPEKIAKVVGGFQEMVMTALDKVIGFLVKKAKKVLAKFGIGKKKKKDDKDGKDGKLTDKEVGKKIKFSADGEGHRLWIDSKGKKPVVMVASTPGPLEVKIKQWMGKVGDLKDDKKRGQAKQFLSEASKLLGVTLTEAEQALIEIKEAERNPDNKKEIAEAKKADDKVEKDEDKLVRILKALFKIFGEKSVLDTFAKELKQTDKAQPDFEKEIIKNYADYHELTDWAAVRKRLIASASTANTLYIQPLGTPNNRRDFQQQNFDKTFIVGLNSAVPAIINERTNPITEERLLKPQSNRREYALERRKVVHRKEAPKHEAGSLALAASVKTELQELLFTGGMLGAASSFKYFKENLRENAYHNEYKVKQPPAIELVDSKLKLTYTYASEAEQNQPKTFVVTVGVDDVNDQLIEHKISGTNLVASDPKFRGNLNVATSGSTTRRNSRNVKLERSHLIADWFGGSGFKDALNIVQTSRHFNRKRMGPIEKAIHGRLAALSTKHPDDHVAMNLTVTAKYEVLGDKTFVDRFRALLTPDNDANIANQKDAIAAKLYAFMQGKQDPRICHDIVYEGNFTLNGEDLEPMPTENTKKDTFKFLKSL